MQTQAILNTILDTISESAMIELIPVENVEHLAILRSKKNGSHGFLIWIDHSSSSQSQIAFRTREGGSTDKYAVMCACCSIKSFEWDEEYDANRHIFNRATGQLIARLCKEHDISELYVRHADIWLKNGFGRMEGVCVREAKEHHRRTNKNDYPFIDYTKSTNI